MYFVCRLGTPEGRIVEEIHESADRRTLLGELERSGYHVFEVRPRGFPLRIGLPSRKSRGRLPARQFLVFNQELAALLRAGLPLLQALDLMRERGSNAHIQELLGDVRERVKGGEDLSEAFAALGDGVPPLYPAILKAGERSGELEAVIRRFIRYHRLLLSARRRVVSALVYPSVLVLLSVGMIGIMGLFVVPRFEDFYLALDVPLPWLTRAVLGVSVFVRSNLLVLTALVAAAAWSARRWTRSPRGRVTFDRWKLSIPFVGPVLHRFSLSELCRSLSTLLAGGIPLVPALEVAIGAVSNRFVRERLVPTIDGVRQGVAFNETLERSGVVTDIAIDMVKVGESTGALDEMLNDVSDFLDEEVETRLERVLTLIEPIMMVLMGGVIATLLIAMYLPMFAAWENMG
jgi:type IV pilus assembly protein PilC